jgi:hypothetical protein
MARDTADFAQQSNERAMQAANFGMTWGREFAEESFNQSRQAVDGFLRVARKMAEDFETQAIATREQMTSLTHKTLSNTMEFGQKLAQAKEPQEFAQSQSEFMARQTQMIADQTKEFGQKMQKAAQTFASNASSAMAEVTSRADQASKRQRAEV